MKKLFKILFYLVYCPCLRNNKENESMELKIITNNTNPNTESKILIENDNISKNNQLCKFWYKINEDEIISSCKINTVTDNSLKDNSLKESLSSISSNESIDDYINVVPNNSPYNSLKIPNMNSNINIVANNSPCNENEDSNINIVANNLPCNGNEDSNINNSISPVSTNIIMNISPNFSYLINKDLD
tara:strand:- start:941 stop:1504 length:564 start_codon:yes stop_codon:yes gene_type:complete